MTDFSVGMLSRNPSMQQEESTDKVVDAEDGEEEEEEDEESQVMVTAARSAAATEAPAGSSSAGSTPLSQDGQAPRGQGKGRERGDESEIDAGGRKRPRTDGHGEIEGGGV